MNRQEVPRRFDFHTPSGCVFSEGGISRAVSYLTRLFVRLLMSLPVDAGSYAGRLKADG